MNWEAIGAIAESLGAIGVIGSLIYLAFQIKQNSRHIESSIYQSTNDVFVNWHATMASDKELADIWYNEIIRDDVKPEHVNQAKALLSMFFLATENNYHHLKIGVVSRDTLAQPGFSELFNRKFVKDWLNREGRSNLTPEFLATVSAVQNRISK